MAVLMGTWDYTELRPVRPAEFSLRRMVQTLTSPLCGWPEDRLLVIENEKAPGDLANRLITAFKDTDIALFYYVGHGQLDNEGNLCLGLQHTSSEVVRRPYTSLPFSAVRTALSESKPAATKIVILDCCFAGAANKLGKGLGLAATGAVANATDELLDTAHGTGAYTMAATGEAGKAWYETDLAIQDPQTFFTKYLADLIDEGIRGAPAELKLHTLFRQLRERLNSDRKPMPESRAVDGARDFAFAYNAAPPETIVDPELELTRTQEEIADLRSLMAVKEAELQAADLERQQMQLKIKELEAMTQREHQLQHEARDLEKSLAEDQLRVAGGHRDHRGRGRRGRAEDTGVAETLQTASTVLTIPTTAQEQGDLQDAIEAAESNRDETIAVQAAVATYPGNTRTPGTTTTPDKSLAAEGPEEPSGISLADADASAAGPGRQLQVADPQVQPQKGTQRLLLQTWAVGAVAIVVAVAGIWILSPHPGTPPASSASFPFHRTRFNDDLVIVRRWTLSGQGGHVFTENITASSASGRALNVMLNEPTPAGIISGFEIVKYSPRPSKIDDVHHIVTWDLPVPATGSISIQYRANVAPAGATEGRLARVARRFETTRKATSEQPQVPVSLQSLKISPAPVRVYVGQTVTIALSGTLSNHNPATSIYLAGPQWKILNPAIATVKHGRITGRVAGRTTIEVSIGTIKISARVIVLSSQPPIVNTQSPPVVPSSSSSHSTIPTNTGSQGP